ncbi:MAG: hypothetical protein ACLR5J_05960 [Lachnospiraceae bacterium]
MSVFCRVGVVLERVQQKCCVLPQLLLGVDKFVSFVQPQLDCHRQGKQELPGRAALPQERL